MTEAPLSAADPVAALLTVLKDHPQTVSLLGGPEHVSGLMEAPWPHLVLANGPGGDLRRALWSMRLEVEFELYGAPAGAPGKAALWRKAADLMQLLVGLPESLTPDEYDPVISDVEPSGVFTYSPTSGGQPRYVFGVYVTIHPPRSWPAP